MSLEEGNNCENDCIYCMPTMMTASQKLPLGIRVPPQPPNPQDPGAGESVRSCLFCRVQWLPSIVLSLGQAWHPFFQHTQGWHGFQAGIFFFFFFFSCKNN